MKQIIPFEKEIIFKKKIKDLISISLDNDLILKNDDLISGNFYIKGSYSSDEKDENYSYKVPCEIAISDDYDTYDATIDIEDFNYEVINNEKLKISIEVAINNLVRKEEQVEEERCIEKEDETIPVVSKEEKRVNIVDSKKPDLINTVNPINTEETYLTYNIYIVKEDDTLDKILERSNTTKEKLKEYNDIENIHTGIKLIIPND